MFIPRLQLATLFLFLISLSDGVFIARVFADQASAIDLRFRDDGIAFLKKYCLKCHGQGELKADLNLFLDKDSSAVSRRRGVWESVVDMVANGQMPPPDQSQPDQGEADRFIALIGEIFDSEDLHSKPDPGRVTVRRLNRTEYNNTVRDLMFIDFNAAEDFPSDDIGHGFDNIGDVLTMAPVLMERYLAAAETIVERAILVGNPPPPPKRRSVATFLKTTNAKEAFEVPFRGLNSNGKLSIAHKLNVDGEYRFRFRGWGNQVGREPVKVAFQIDEKIVETVEVNATISEKATYEIKPINLSVGEHTIAVLFLNEFTDPDVPKIEDAQRSLFVEFFELEGPIDMVPPSHKRLLLCDPDISKRDQTREVLSRFLLRAYRRPVLNEEVDRLVALVMQAMDLGESWEGAMRRAMMATLVSPKFLFRLELDDRPESPESRPLNEFQLASRISYFLWSTMPDDELFTLASKGELTKNLDSQVRRMLADARSIALVENFAIQWLQLTRLKTASPDSKQFPLFNDSLRSAMLKETELFFEAIIREDRNVLELIDADFTFLNPLLAHHYGLDEAFKNSLKVNAGSRVGPNRDFVRVALPDKYRGGLLTQASVLTATSNPTRTSPVKRGRWILEQILGTPPPPPPPNVPELADGEKAQLTGSLRQRMQQHRSNSACANCHAKMDPLGFAFENYDAIGAYRERDGEFPIDSGGVLPGGNVFEGPVQLKLILLKQYAKVDRNLIQKLMTYGLGRGLEYYDRRWVMGVQEALEQNDFRFSTLVTEIVRSEPFRMRRGSDEMSKGP